LDGSNAKLVNQLTNELSRLFFDCGMQCMESKSELAGCSDQCFTLKVQKLNEFRKQYPTLVIHPSATCKLLPIFTSDSAETNRGSNLLSFSSTPNKKTLLQLWQEKKKLSDSA
jgi:hypothetical protein